MHIYQYADKRGAPVAAKREIELLSHAFTKAVEWGYISRHPFKGEVRLKGFKPRDRYIEDWEVLECLSLEPKQNARTIEMIQLYIKLKLLTGLRKGDLLKITKNSFKDDGIHITTSKTKKSVVYKWNEDLKIIVNQIIQRCGVEKSDYLFCTRRGEHYINSWGDASGWNSIWQRFMKRVLQETKVKERFTEHDLRAKVASDAKSLEHARSLLAHSNSSITSKVYRRKVEVIEPATYKKEDK